MIRRHLMALRFALMVGDGATAVLTFWTVTLIRLGDEDAATFLSNRGIEVGPAAILLGVAWVAILWSRGLYALNARWRLRTEAMDTAKAAGLGLLLTLSGLFVLNVGQGSRRIFILLFLLQPIVTVAVRFVLREAFGFVRRRGYHVRYMLVAGTGTLAEEFANQLERRKVLGIRVIGHLSVPDESERAVSRPVLGDLTMMETIFHRETVDEVAICLPPTATDWVGPITRLAADEGKAVRIPLNPIMATPPGARDEEFEGFLVRSLVSDGQREVGFLVKRLIDIAGATVGLIVLSPLLLGIALAIRMRDGSPTLFQQSRVGLHGRRFTIYKFRTMDRDADARFADVEAVSDTRGAAFKMSKDPRVTRLGVSLRRTGLDELPQLWNVLRGEMSLVGPRPAPPREVDRYDVWHRRRLSVRPGITGLWQVEARFDEHFDDRANLDLRYIDHWSLALDLKLLLRTIPAAFARPGR